MQSMTYKEILQHTHKGSIDNWFNSAEEYKAQEEDMGGDTILDFINREVWKDESTGKWIFMGKEFKRQGQAEKAAMQYFKKNKGSDHYELV